MILTLALPQFAAAQALTDAALIEARTAALDKLPKLTCLNGRRCAPATDAERANPPVSLAETRLAMEEGIRADLLRLCGRDWRRESANPFMKAQLEGGASPQKYVLMGELFEAGRLFTRGPGAGLKPVTPDCATLK